MAVESKIRELLAKSREVEAELTEEANELDEAAASRPLDKSQGDASMPAQGSSNSSPEMVDLSGTGDKNGGLTAEIGKAAIGKQGTATAPATTGAGQAPNFEGGTDTASVVNQPTSQGVREDEEVSDEETLFDGDIEGLFGDEDGLSEEFKVKAASLFEAVVTARVSAEVEEIEKELAEEARIAQETLKEEMVEKIDGYLSYVAENWMKENELAVEHGLRTEITEDFIKGMQTLFSEHYIEVPTEKYDVLGEMQAEIDSLKSKLDESIEDKVAMVAETTDLLRSKVIAESTKDLTVTEAEKLAKLVEDVEFDNQDLFAEKVAVIKENYFPKVRATDDDKMDDTVAEEMVDGNSPMSIYANAISKAVKK
jgi:regulator of replication initiation timing